MLRFEAFTHNIFDLVKDDLAIITKNDIPDITIVCKDHEIVKTHKNIFCLFSPFLREILGSVVNMDTPMLLLPEFKRGTVENVIRLLNFEWTENELWEFEVIELLKTLNIKVGTFHPNAEDLPMEEIPGDENTGMDEIYLMDNLDIVMNEGKSYETKCPSCPLYIFGTTSVIQYKMRLHLGQVHFPNELNAEVEVYFGNSMKCVKCEKIFENKSSQKQHLIFNHTNHTNFMHEIQTIIDSVKLCGPNETEQNGSTSTQHEDTSKTQTVLSHISQEKDDEENFNENESIFHKNDSDSQMRKVGVANARIYSCIFDNCMKSWNKHDTFMFRRHILTHFNPQMLENLGNYFQGSKCKKCPRVEIPKTTEQKRHLYFEHGVLKEDVEHILYQIKNNSQSTIHNDTIGPSEKEIKKGDDEILEKPSTVIEANISHKDLSEKEDIDIDIDSLHRSDTEEHNDSMDIENTGVFQCALDCNKTWEKFKANNISQHILTHFKQQISELSEHYFEGTKCIKCSRINSNFLKNSVRNRHLYQIHDIMKTEISDILNQIKGSSKLESPKAENNVDKLLENISTEDINPGISIPEIDRDEDNGLLLHSEDEDDDDTMDIQNMILADVSDDDSDIEVDTVREYSDYNDEEPDMEIQKKLLESQDFSDSDTDDEDIEVDVDNYVECDTNEKQSNHDYAEKNTFLQKDIETNTMEIPKRLRKLQNLLCEDEDDENMSDDNRIVDNDDTIEKHLDSDSAEKKKSCMKDTETDAPEVLLDLDTDEASIDNNTNKELDGNTEKNKNFEKETKIDAPKAHINDENVRGHDESYVEDDTNNGGNTEKEESSTKEREIDAAKVPIQDKTQESQELFDFHTDKENIGNDNVYGDEDESPNVVDQNLDDSDLIQMNLLQDQDLSDDDDDDNND